MYTRCAAPYLVTITLTACGAAVIPQALPGPASSAASEPPVAALEPASVAALDPVEPPADGMQLAAGRLGSVLDGLRPGDWTGIPGEHGRVETGHDVPSDHMLIRTTDAGTYPAHVVAWESFRSVPEDADLQLAAMARAGRDARVFEVEDSDLAVAAVIPPFEGQGLSSGPRGWISSRRGLFLAELSVAVRGGTFVHILLACIDSAACRSDDREGLVRAVAASLRRGPRLRGGGTWELRLPNGASDRRIRLSLPADVVGLRPRIRYDGAIVAPAMGLATGRVALNIILDVGPERQEIDWLLEPGAGAPLPEPLPSVARLSCAPFRCLAVLGRDEGTSRLAAALAGASVESVPAENGSIPLAGGRLAILALAPSIDRRELGDTELDDPTESAVRYDGVQLRLRVRDTLRPARDAMAAGGFLVEGGFVAADGSNVQPLEAGDPLLRVTRILPAEPADTRYHEFVASRLLVADQDGTGLIVEVLCRRGEPCETESRRISADLALRFRHGAPLETEPTLSLSLAGRRMEIDLPEGYVTTSWSGEDHGGWGLTARHVTGSVASLEFEVSGAAPGASIENTGRRRRGRTTLRLGSDRFVMRERGDGQRMSVWGADLGCRRSACVILIRTDDTAERDRLLAALASARVTLVQ